MDAAIIANYNRKVRDRDRFFILGDFCWGNKFSEYCALINCKNIIFIKGNHDKGDYSCFKEVHNYYELKTQVECRKQFIVMFHYPILEWNKWHRGSWHITGHCHGNCSWSHPDDDRAYCLDVGVDCHDFKPLNLSDIDKAMSKKGKLQIESMKKTSELSPESN